MDFLPQNIDAYATSHTDEEAEYLVDLYRETHLNVIGPRMLSGHLQGRVLSFLSKMVKPKFILELGTYTGYSALCLAEGLVDGGQLVTIDCDEELSTIQQKYFKRSPYDGMIKPVVADALTYIPDIEEEIDLVFIDADKENYENYYKVLLPKIKPGGYIIADNVLWSGKVVEPIKDSDTETAALVAFNKHVQADPGVENVLLPIRDGLMVIRKK